MTTLKQATQSLENLWNISYNGIKWTESNNLPTKLALPYHPRSSLINSLIFIYYYKYLMIKSILIHEYQHKSTEVNTNQHEPDKSQHESTWVWHESTRINMSLTRVKTSLKRVNTSPTQVNTNQHKSKSVLDELAWVNTSPTRV